MPRKGCPHAEIRFCPLYVALHDPVLVRWGCDDGRLDAGSECGAARRIDYEARLRQLRKRAPLMVAQCERRAREAWREPPGVQRARNMALLGLTDDDPKRRD